MNPIRPAPEKVAAPEQTEHILYELWMFCVTIEFFTLSNDERRAWIAEAPQRVVNAIMESMLLHTRLLGDFFGRPKPPFDKDDQELSLYTDKKIPETGLTADLIKKINKEVAHLSDKRPAGDDPNKERWDVRKLFNAVSVAIQPFLPELERSANVTLKLRETNKTMVAAFERTRARLLPGVDLSRQAGLTATTAGPIAIPNIYEGESEMESSSPEESVPKPD